MRARVSLILAATLFCSACSSGDPGRSIPPGNPASNAKAAAADLASAGRVTDAAHVLTLDQVAGLTAKLEQLERTTRHQMVVVTVASLGGRDVAGFARDLGNSWGVGRKGHDDGVVLLVAPNERKVRIAVGYGLERTLPQEACQQIIDRAILPRFRQRDLAGGIEAGTDALIARLK